MITGRGLSYFLTKARPRHLAANPHRRRGRTAIVLALALVAAPLPAALAQQDQPFQAFEIRRTYGSDMGVAAPVGVAYLAQSDTLVVADGMGMAVEATRAGEAVSQAFGLTGDAVTLAVDAAGDLVTVAGGVLHTSSPGAGSSTTKPSPVGTAAGAAFDAGTGSLLLLEGTDLVNAASGERTTLQGIGAGAIRGLAVDPANGLIYVGMPSGRMVRVFDRTGTPMRSIDLSAVEIGDQQGMTIAPSADPTDDPSVQRLYLADASGALIEVAIEPEAIVITAATVSVAALRRIYETSQFNPASPDPSGVTYVPSRTDLLISDGEVDETTGAGFHNVNLWYVDPASGSVTATGNTVALSPSNNEPTGVDYDPINNRLFVTNDNSGGYVDVHQPGNDGLFGTPDDSKYRMPTNGFGLPVDSEGVAYHQGNGHIYIADGVGREVWDVNPGPNGIFQGGGSDDTITHFDIQKYGAGDPEGIAYSPASGRLLVLDDNSSTVYELDISGTLVNQIDISASTGSRQAGVTLAPASSGPGESLYIVDRRVDNGANSSENDGRMYEMSAPLAAAGNQPPVADAGPDQQIAASVFPVVANLDGTASTDDNAVASFSWTKLSGPNATINSPSSATTTVSLSATGVYTFQLEVSDAEPLSDTDEMTITVAGPGGPFTWDGAIATGPDDAEELGTGGMRLGNADLELVVKGTDVQTVGLRFMNVQIPPGSAIESAYVQFQANSVSTGAANLVIEAQASDNAPPFASGLGNISTRPRGNVAVPWTPPTWDQNDEVGPDQQTADLKFLIQEVVQRPGWAAGNAIALIITGSGTRIANAIEGGFASQLHVVYSTGGPPPNQPPLANAGPDQQVTMALPATATLDGSGSTDDTGITSFAWSQLSGPGTATITNTDQEVSDVSLPEFGTYTFQLMVTDGGGLTDTDEVVITVLDPSGPQTLETPVAVGADDAEEKPTGRVTLTNGDLDLVLDSSTNMTTALRFTGVNIPAGAIITNAYIQFRSDEIQADTANLVIQGHDVANAPAFTTVKFNITGRARTTAGVAWSPDPWTGNRLTGLAQRTPDLKSIVSELTAAGSGWTSGNAMVFIISGSGKRTADSFEGGFASRLVIEYSVP